MAANSIYIPGFMGLGDNLNLRPLVRDCLPRFSRVFLRTPCPELFHDLFHPEKLFFVKPANPLRTQKIAMDDWPPSTWTNLPPHRKGREINLKHSINDMLAGISVPEKCKKMLEDPNQYDFAFPVKDDWIMKARIELDKRMLGKRIKPLLVVHPPTVRKEWECSSRNPKIEYIQTIIDQCRDTHTIISVAHLRDGIEWADSTLHGIDVRFEHGELSLTAVCGLCKLASMVLCSPSFFMLLGIAIRTKTFCVFGGHIPPKFLIHDCMDLSKFGYSAPEPFCFCAEKGGPRHDCNKEIPKQKLISDFTKLKNREKERKVTIGMPAGIGDTHWILLKLESFRKLNKIDHLSICIHEDSGHKHSAAFLERIPFIDSVICKPDPFQFIWNIPPLERHTTCLENVEGCDFRVEFNSELEAGHRIETILPKYKVNWNYEIPYADKDREFAERVKKQTGRKLVVLYASSRGGNNNFIWTGGKWCIDDWVKIIQELNKRKITPVLIGAGWDLEYAEDLELRCDELDLPENAFLNMVGHTSIWKTMALIRECDAFIGFPSGMGIMSVKFQRPTVMFWPCCHEWFDVGFHTAWVDPKTLKKKLYYPMKYGSPDARPKKIISILGDAL